MLKLISNKRALKWSLWFYIFVTGVLFYKFRVSRRKKSKIEIYYMNIETSHGMLSVQSERIQINSHLFLKVSANSEETGLCK